MSSPRAPSFSPLTPRPADLRDDFGTPEPLALDGDHKMADQEETLFLTPPPQASPRNSTQSQKPNRAIIKRTGIEADEERNRRIAQHADEYEALIEDINNRSLLRNYIETRRRIWKQSIEKAQAKIEEIEAEKKELQRSIDGMEEAWMEFEGKYDWLGTKEYDLEVKEMFDLYFNLDVEVLSMENVKQGGAGDGPHGDEEDAGSVNGDGQDLGGAA